MPALLCVQALDRDRLALAEERRTLSDARIASSQAADAARGAQLKLADAVRGYVQQGVPIPFAVDGEHACTRTTRCRSSSTAAGSACAHACARALMLWVDALPCLHRAEIAVVFKRSFMRLGVL